MRSAIPSTRLFVPMAVAALVAASVGGLARSAPDAENGRYTMTPTPEGVLRLDTRTGTVSTCSKNDAGWACYAVPDERAALDAEIGRLQSELEKLKRQLAEGPTVSGKIDEALPKSDSLKQPQPKVSEGERKLEIPLPSDHDVDRMVSFLERAWRQLIELANRVQKDLSGKI